MNPVVKGVLQGAIPTLVLVGGTNLIVKKFRESKPVLYWGSLAVATGVAVAVVQGRITTPFMNAENFEARDNSWCVNHGWIRGGTKIGDIIPCSNCNDMICDGCRCGGCGNCNTSDCCECSQ